MWLPALFRQFLTDFVDVQVNTDLLLCLMSDISRFVSRCAKYSSVNIEQPKQVNVVLKM
jgi:hypothetical protein